MISVFIKIDGDRVYIGKAANISDKRGLQEIAESLKMFYDGDAVKFRELIDKFTEGEIDESF